MEQIEKEVIEWHKETFPNATEQAISDKCAEELNELFNVNTPDEYWDEIADVIISNMAFIAKASGGTVTLADVVRRKLEINKSRIWGKEKEDGSRDREK